MVFEFIPSSTFNFLLDFAKKQNIEVEGNSLQIPPSLGSGFIKRITVNDDFFVVIHKYRLKEPFLLKRIASDEWNDTLIFRFVSYDTSDKKYLSNIQVFNIGVGVDDYIEAGTTVSYVVVSIKKSRLPSLIEFDGDMGGLNPFFEDINKPFLYQEDMTFDIKKILIELTEVQNLGKLERLYYKAGIMQLIYLFFTKLLDRETSGISSINKVDITKILAVEKLILNNPGTPPKLPDLARTIGMSPTKMKQLFRKIFGDSIYNYYQSARINEAALLLKNDKNRSVSDVGYTLGFSNLGYFSQLFKKHTGLNPKEYSLQYRKES